MLFFKNSLFLTEVGCRLATNSGECVLLTFLQRSKDENNNGIQATIFTFC